MSQLRKSYSRIIEATLKKVRDGGVLRDAGRDTMDELGFLWRRGVDRALETMETRHQQRGEELAPAIKPTATFSLDQPAAKKPRLDIGESEPSLSGDVGGLAPGASVIPQPADASAIAAPPKEESDDEYADCFEDAEVVVSKPPVENTPAPAVSTTQVADVECLFIDTKNAKNRVKPIAIRALEVKREESSAGSDLGSDLDDSEWEEPVVINTILAELKSVRRSKRRWSVEMKHGVLQIDGVECLFSGASGVFEYNDGLGPDASSKLAATPGASSKPAGRSKNINLD